MRTKVLYMLALLLVLSVGQAEAQRILPRMQGVEMRGGMTSDNGYYMGMILSSYAKGGNKWVYGAEYLHMKHGYRHVTIPSAQFTAEGGYYLNFLSDAGKVFFLNLGGSALAGYETVNWSDKKLYDGATLKNGDAFVYGCALTLEMELYLADRVALTPAQRSAIWRRMPFARRRRFPRSPALSTHARMAHTRIWTFCSCSAAQRRSGRGFAGWSASGWTVLHRCSCRVQGGRQRQRCCRRPAA